MIATRSQGCLLTLSVLFVMVFFGVGTYQMVETFHLMQWARVLLSAVVAVIITGAFLYVLTRP